MSVRTLLAQEFVQLWRYLVEEVAIPIALALLDPRIQAARRRYNVPWAYA